MSPENVLIALRWNRDAIAEATRWGAGDGEHFTGENRCSVLSSSETVAALREVPPTARPRRCATSGSARKQTPSRCSTPPSRASAHH
jgi:hypothetical protein